MTLIEGYTSEGHYMQANQLVRDAENQPYKDQTILLAAAQVQATLALVLKGAR